MRTEAGRTVPIERDIQKIRRRLIREGWVTVPSRGPHEKFEHPARPVTVVLPRGRGDLATGTARSIALAAGWI
jgi:predicted RNA binding protein YcfA (HicA-like mRNA interferase family)